jgi:tetratricopeptide (TPR) repeat protein
MFDPDHPGGLQLMDDIAIEIDRQHVARIIAEARAELQKGQLDRAEALVADARAIAPDSADVQQVQEAIDTTRREIERTRQIQEAMRRARQRFTEGGYEAAIRAAGEVLAIDPENAQAKDLQQRANEAIEHQKTRGERDAAAQAVVALARKKFESGDKDGAIKELEAFKGKHDLVTAFLATLKGEKLPEPEPSSGGETAHILRGARGPTADLPARRNFLIAGVSFSVIVIAATLYFQPWSKNAAAPPTDVPSTPANTSAASVTPPESPSPSPAPAPIPPVTAPPVASAESLQDTQDFQAAYNLLSKDDVAGAQKIAAAIRKRNPKFPMLATLSTAITTRENEIKRREEQIAEQQKIAAALEEEKKRSAAAQREAEQAKASASPVMSTLPGGGFVAPSAPPTPELRGEAERPALEKAIAQWAAAFARLDVQALSNVRALTPDEAKRWQNTFKNMGKYEMNVRIVGTPQVVDNEALVPVEEIARYAGKGNNQPTMTMNPLRTNYRLRKIGNEWKLLVPTTPMP